MTFGSKMNFLRTPRIAASPEKQSVGIVVTVSDQMIGEEQNF